MANKLQGYNSSRFVDLKDSLQHYKSNKLDMSNTSLYYNYNDDCIITNMNLLDIYKESLLNHVEEAEWMDDYTYRPERFSLDYYGSIELWYITLWLNNITTIHDFKNLKSVVYLNHSGIQLLMNILKKYSIDLEDSKDHPKFIEDLTIKKIIL